jgi:hypothetical protein
VVPFTFAFSDMLADYAGLFNGQMASQKFQLVYSQRLILEDAGKTPQRA